MSLYEAVEILTTKREQSCCVERNYVRKIYDYYTLSEDLSSNKREAEKIDISYITNWEKLHDSFIGTALYNFYATSEVDEASLHKA